MSVRTRTHHTRKAKRVVKPVIKAKAKAKSKINSWEGVFDDVFNKYTKAGALLKGYRYKLEMTQKELSEEVGVSQNHLSEMENGKRSIGKEVAKRFAEYFDTDYRLFL